MENNTYLDKVVEFLVRDTMIDYDEDEIQFPFFPSSFYFSTIFSLSSPSRSPLLTFPPTLPSSSFSKYCIDVYGLTDQEIEYVWNQYKDIIKDKITNK